MARKLYSPQPLPAHYDRITLEDPQPIKFRNINDTEGRGNNWEKGNLWGWDRHLTEEPCPIVYAREGGGWRTLSPEIFEWKL